MFGYITCNKSELTDEEKNRYQSIYCGLCRNMKRRYGQLERFSLNYDMAFLILFLSSLYEPPETEESFRCGIHPLTTRTSVENCFTEYAADMTIILTYYKCLDDWRDEKKRARRWYGNMLKKEYQLLSEKYPRQCAQILNSTKELTRIEQNPSSSPDQAVNCSGQMLSELFVYKEDFWSGSLRSFGYELGRFIYLLDAAIDYDDDLKQQNYNPLIKFQKRPDEMRPVLKMPLGNCTEIFEKLPLVQDAHLLRGILYNGVWLQYDARIQRKEKKHG